MADITVTNTQGLLNDGKLITANVATTDTANTAQAFVITPTERDAKMAIMLTNGPTHGTVSCVISAGTGYWAAKAAKTITVAQATSKIIYLESAAFKLADGTIVITATPASGKKLASEHVFTVSVVNEPIAN
jgi:hypothetical protein